MKLFFFQTAVRKLSALRSLHHTFPGLLTAVSTVIDYRLTNVLKTMHFLLHSSAMYKTTIDANFETMFFLLPFSSPSLQIAAST